MLQWLSRALCLALAMIGLAAIARAELPVLRVAALEGGTVTWELDTIRHYGLDRAEGFVLEILSNAKPVPEGVLDQVFIHVEVSHFAAA